MPKNELRRRALKLLDQEARYQLPIQIRYLLIGLAAGLLAGGFTFAISQ